MVSGYSNTFFTNFYVLTAKKGEVISKTINKGSVDLDKFPVSKVHQLAKKMDPSNKWLVIPKQPRST